jgi:hypothetical protein
MPNLSSLGEWVPAQIFLFSLMGKLTTSHPNSCTQAGKKPLQSQINFLIFSQWEHTALLTVVKGDQGVI